jgi:hypothetical protein
MQFVNNLLQVTHKDRFATTYYLRNRAEVERTVWLEHFVLPERRLVGDAAPEVGDQRRARFKLVLPPGKTLTQTLVEELREARPDTITLSTGATIVGTASREWNDLPAERYITGLGFEVWQTRAPPTESLLSARFVKGELSTSTLNQEAFTYHIRNTSGERQSFTIDHQVRPKWSLGSGLKPVEGARQPHRFEVKAKKDETARQVVTEERIVSRKEALAELNEDRIKVFVSSDKIAVGVKEQIRQGTSMLRSLGQTDAALKELQGRLKEIVDEQARIKGNLEKLPASSELYKRLIDKFDKQETALEQAQQQIAEKVAQGKRQRNDLEKFFEKLSGD